MLGTVEANSQLAITHSDSDDDLPAVAKKRVSVPKIFESDSESDAASVTKTTQLGSDENDNSVKSSTERVHAIHLVNGDANSDHDSVESRRNHDECKRGKRRLRPQLFESDEESNTGNMSSKDTGSDDGSPAKLLQKKRPSSLFDSDGESNSVKSDDGSSHSDDENSGEEIVGDIQQQADLFDTEETETPKEISESLKKRLAKGAAKKGGSRQATTGMRKDPDELMQIHSESQRIVRESRIKLPYHQPKPKSLAEILARTKEKQEKIKANETRLMLNKNKDPLSICNTKVDLTKTGQTKTVDDGLPSLRERITARKNTSPKQTEMPKKEVSNSQDYELQTPLADDELPDLGNALGSVNQPVLSDSVCGDSADSNKVIKKSGSSQSDAGDKILVEESNLGKDHNVAVMTRAKEEDSLLQQGETQMLHLELEMSEQPDSEQVIEPETGTQALHLELDVSQSVPHVNDCDIIEHLDSSSASKLPPTGMDSTSKSSPKDQTGCASEHLSKEQTGSAKNLSPKDKRERLRAQLAEKLKGLTPKLSGPSDNMIDLDGGDETPVSDRKPAGMTNLMQRLQKHSLKKKKKSKDIVISMVKKEMVDGEREELRLEKMTVHVHADASSQDHLPPGGKWDKVKQKLAAALKVKREEARKRRCELYELENEEGFEERMEEEKEEAELTDQTDTEESEGEEAGGIDWEDEEDDDDYEPGMDVDRERKKSEFVDEEAEEDESEYDGDTEEDAVSDIGDIEPEDLKLHLEGGSDEEEEENPEAEATTMSESTAESAHQSVVSADSRAESVVKPVRPAIVHTSVLDEDAISHSPLSQQDSKGGKEECNTITARPFQQLSQSKVLEGEAEEDGPDKSVNVPVEVVCEGSLFSADASFDLTSSLIPAGQRSSSKSQRDLTTPDFFRARSRVGRDTPDLFSTSSKMSTNSTASSSTRKFDDLTLPIEDSQQLFLCKASPPKGPDSLSADTNSRWLDDDGFLKPAKRQLHLEYVEPSSQENMDELLGLCSGKFTGEHTEKSISNVSSLGFGSQLPSTQSNMDELLGLCSGQFTGKQMSQKSSGTQASTGFNAIDGLQSLGTQGQSTQANMNELLGLCSGTFRTSSPTPGVDDSPKKPSQRKRKRTVAVVSDDEDDFEVKEGSNAGQAVDDAIAETGGFGESDDEHEQVDADGDGEEDNKDQGDTEDHQKFKGFKTKKGKMRKEFLEVEAELSGSEYDSDENLDLDERDDIMEEEEGDRDDLGMTEEELRNQVGRVHLKGMIDEDKRQIRLMQEMYLADGDLHSDSNGRMRRFRWRHIDDADGSNILGGDSDNENHAEEENEQDHKWRLERYEREKFIEEQQGESIQDSEDSQLLKLGKVLLKRQFSHTRSKSLQEKPTSKVTAPTTPESVSKQKLVSKGSLLSRNKAALDKIVQLAKPITNPNGTRHSRNFVFSALSPDAKPSKPQLHRATSKTEPPAKRPKLERSNSLPAKSIFKHI